MKRHYPTARYSQGMQEIVDFVVAESCEMCIVIGVNERKNAVGQLYRMLLDLEMWGDAAVRDLINRKPV
jgi:hypothetical protein